MMDETISVKEQYYDLSKYKDEVAQFVVKKRGDLDVLSTMESNYYALKKVVYAGDSSAAEERFPHAAEIFKVYKSAIIASSLEGYSALVEITGLDAYSILKVPELKKVMTEQFKSMSLLEKISSDTVDDWILKGEAISFIKLKSDKEEYRMKQTLTDLETGEPFIKFTMKEIVGYDHIEIERIDPLDFYVDAFDYEKDPRGCAKIIRSWVSVKELLTSDAYPMLTKEDKDSIIASVGKSGNGTGDFGSYSRNESNNYNRNKTDKNRIEILTYYGDYITSDNKVLINIVATVVNNRIANLRYSGVSTNRIIYSGYKIDEQTHRSIIPIASARPVNTLVNRTVDLFLKNLENISDPMMMVQAGSLTFQQSEEGRAKKFIEYNSLEAKPEFWTPPQAPVQGLQLIETVLNQNKNMLGLNSYISGNTDGSVRTAEETSALFRAANTRMRVETDVFNYKYLLSLFISFYAFNRELALSADRPLDPIYNDERLRVSISTNASRADKEGEFNRLMQMLNLPLTQMIFSNLQPEQVILAVRYLMAKAGLTDADNILELVDSATAPQEEQQLANVGGQGQVGQDLMPSEIPDINPSTPGSLKEDINNSNNTTGAEQVPLNTQIQELQQ